MKHVLALCLCLIPTFPWAQSQAPVDIASEPHHHVLLENDKVRVFEVTVGPHQATQLTRHDHNYLVITPDESEIAAWADGEAGVITYRYGQNDVRFFFGGKAGTLRNDDAIEYHNLTVEFLGDGVTTYGYQAGTGRWQYGAGVMPPPVDPRAKFATVMPLGQATVRDVQLLPDDFCPAPEHDAAELIVALGDIELRNGDERIRKSRGELAWISSPRKADLANRGAGPARFVIIELRDSVPKEKASN